MTGVPGAVEQVTGELPGEAAEHRGLDEAPGRAGALRRGIEQVLGPSVVGLGEPVGAALRDEHGADRDAATESVGERLRRRVAARLDLEHLRRVLPHPELLDAARVT